ncbi:hypothetical protein EDB83DRAFT_2577586 [Lactarius deliciosus]|nr:hypothetical protein EDB83DRAFT_2577586 [Lactarius deliciosus]
MRHQLSPKFLGGIACLCMTLGRFACYVCFTRMSSCYIRVKHTGNASPWAQPPERLDSQGPAILTGMAHAIQEAGRAAPRHARAQAVSSWLDNHGFVMPSCGRPECTLDCGLQQAVSEYAGLRHPIDPGIEASLNLQFAEAMTYSTPITVPQYKLPTFWINWEV